MRNKRIRLYREDSNFSVVVTWINRIILLSCWGSVFIAIYTFVKTANLGLTALIGMYTPVRYFLFDVAPSKLERRPPSLDRVIPLTIFVRYLRIKFPIPQGNILATISGFFLACGRTMINGYALLFFDTFTFLFSIRNNKKGIPLDKNIGVLHDNKALIELEEQIEETNSESKEERLKKLQYEWKQTAITNSLSVWDFPLRRYLEKPTYYFKNKEIGNSVIDNKYILEDDEDTKNKDKAEKIDATADKLVDLESLL